MFDDAIHLVGSISALGRLRQTVTGKRIFTTNDRLTSGPCDIDPIRHGKLRRSWDMETAGAPAVGFRRPVDLEDLHAAVLGTDPIILWGTRAFSDLVWLWWAIDGLGRIGTAGRQVFLARPQTGAHLTVGGSTADEILGALKTASVLNDNEWREGTNLWAMYVSSSPCAFDEARRHGSNVFPELTKSAEPHGGWFPRFNGGRLKLSVLDEVLLSLLDNDYQSVWDVFKRTDRIEFTPFDVYFPVERLRAWAARGVIERESVINDNPLEQDRFRATDRSRALLQVGITEVSYAPPLFVGGCLVNDPASPWIRSDHSSGWRLCRPDP